MSHLYSTAVANRNSQIAHICRRQFGAQHGALRYYGVTRHIYSARYLNCHTWTKETGHSTNDLLLQLNYGLQNSLKYA